MRSLINILDLSQTGIQADREGILSGDLHSIVFLRIM